MLAAYGDDSIESDIVVAAMCVAPARQWDRFLPEWSANVLRPHDLAVFHMEPFVRRTSEYMGWPEGEYEEQFVRVASLMGNRTTIRAAVAVDSQKWRKRMATYSKGRPFSPISAYTFAVMGAMMIVASIADRRSEDQDILYVMDAGAGDFPQTVRYVTETYQRNMDDKAFRHWSCGILPGNVRQYPQMQTADVVAYCVRESIKGPDSRVVPYLNLLVRLAPVDFIYAHEDETFDRMEASFDQTVDHLRKERWLKERERLRAKYGRAEE